MNATVMKFGGTSVADGSAISRVVGLVRTEIGRGKSPVVVVSALSGVTDRLLSLAKTAGTGERIDVQHGLDELLARHETVASAVVTGPRHASLLDSLHARFEELRAMLTALSVLREASPRSLDGIAAAGELSSSRIVAAALEEAGIPSIWVDARAVVITDDNYMRAAPINSLTEAAVERTIDEPIRSGMVPVVGGFVGATREGVTTTLGRGGSDYSAAILGAALNNHRTTEIQIWTDVDGMLTADPRVINGKDGPDGPRVVSQLSFGEASELAYFGAKVLHPSTILPAVESDIPVRILNSRRPEASGTLITSRMAVRNDPIAAIACKRRITVVEVTSTRMLMAHGFMRRLFEVFERHTTSVDVVTTSEVSVSVTVDDDRNLDAIVGELREFAEVAVEPNMALLCVVGDNLRADPRLAIRVLGSLEGFPLRMVSQAASRRNVTVVLRERDLADATIRLHDTWFVRPKPSLADRPTGT